MGAASALLGGVLITVDAPGAWAWAAFVGAALGVLFTTAMTLPLGVACRVLAGPQPRLIVEEAAVR